MQADLLVLRERGGFRPRYKLIPLVGGDIAAVYRLASDQGLVVVKLEAASR